MGNCFKANHMEIIRDQRWTAEGFPRKNLTLENCSRISKEFVEESHKDI